MNVSPEFEAKLITFIAGAQAKVDANQADLFANSTPEIRESLRETLRVNPNSRRYVGIFAFRPSDVKFGRIYAFVDTYNGDVLKPESYRKPAKHARSNIFDASNGLDGVDHYGPKYLI